METMSDKRQLNLGGVATARQPRLVLVGGVGAVSNTASGRVADQFRNLGWDVFNVPVGNDLACSVLARKPSAVLLPVETGWESGYLIAAKLRTAKRKLKVVLVTKTRTTEAERFAKFVGADARRRNRRHGKLVNAVTG